MLFIQQLFHDEQRFSSEKHHVSGVQTSHPLIQKHRWRRTKVIRRTSISPNPGPRSRLALKKCLSSAEVLIESPNKISKMWAVLKVLIESPTPVGWWLVIGDYTTQYIHCSCVSGLPWAPWCLYLFTYKTGYYNFVRANIGKYSSTMEHMGLKVRFFDSYICHIIDQATERYGTGAPSCTNWIPSSKLTVCYWKWIIEKGDLPITSNGDCPWLW